MIDPNTICQECSRPIHEGSCNTRLIGGGVCQCGDEFEKLVNLWVADYMDKLKEGEKKYIRKDGIISYDVLPVSERKYVYPKEVKRIVA